MVYDVDHVSPNSRTAALIQWAPKDLLAHSHARIWFQPPNKLQRQEEFYLRGVVKKNQDIFARSLETYPPLPSIPQSSAKITCDTIVWAPKKEVNSVSDCRVQTSNTQ